MKQKLTIAAIALVVMLFPTVVKAQNIPHTPPDKAKYSIIGRMQYDNNSRSRYLLNAQGTGISFEYQARRLAKPTQMADLVVRFDSVRTNPERPMTFLNFWRYDEEIGEWIYDREVRQGGDQMETTMKTSIMLVIDNSKSLAEDFKRAQDAAIEYVEQLYRASNNKDIFRVGVIGFSTVQFTRVRDIAPLDANNLREITKFIRSLNMQNGTALYYSLDTALVLLERDAMNIPSNEYKESRIIAFTDGLDQASVADYRNLHSPTMYYDYLRPIMQGTQTRKKIMNKTIHSTIVVVKGGDVTASQERVMEQRAAAICDDVRKLNDMSQLVPEFKKLAEELIKSNMVLYCYIPVGAEGLVGWTFDDEDEPVAVAPTPAPTPRPDPTPQPRPSGENKFWLGVGLEGGGAFCRYREYGWWYNSFEGQDEWVLREEGSYLYPYIGVNIDAAFHLSSKFAIGASGSFMMTSNIDPGFKVGPLIKYTFNNNSALLVGAGMKMWFGDFYLNDIDLYLSLGWKFKSRWYVTANAGLYSYGLSVGYSIFDSK